VLANSCLPPSLPPPVFVVEPCLRSRAADEKALPVRVGLLALICSYVSHLYDHDSLRRPSTQSLRTQDSSSALQLARWVRGREDRVASSDLIVDDLGAANAGRQRVAAVGAKSESLNGARAATARVGSDDDQRRGGAALATALRQSRGVGEDGDGGGQKGDLEGHGCLMVGIGGCEVLGNGWLGDVRMEVWSGLYLLVSRRWKGGYIPS